jgi:DNA-binding transcriptional MocR family regulator
MQEFAKFPAQKSRAAFVVDEILRAIKEDRLRVGSQLPSERVLAEQLGVGRAAIREALSAVSTMISISPSQKQQAPRFSYACFAPLWRLYSSRAPLRLMARIPMSTTWKSLGKM